MSIVGQLNKQIQEKHPGCEVGTVLVDNNSRSGHSVHFYSFVFRQLKYVISTYKEASAYRMNRENTTMMKLKKQVTSQDFMNSLLFSFEVVCLGDECFRIQKYFSNNKLRKVFRKGAPKPVEKYLNVSFDWLTSFQGIKEKHKASEGDLIKEIRGIAHYFPHSHKGTQWFNELVDNCSSQHWDLQKGVSHGDFCFYNCLFDGQNRFLVYDWEHVSEDYWLFYDPLLNLNSVWQYFFERGRVKSMYDVLILKQVEKKFEALFSQYADLITGKYGLSLKQFLLLCVFVFFRNQTREGKTGVIAADAPYINIDGVLAL